jgi:selenocysteine lyase/cysteine desulfurase
MGVRVFTGDHRSGTLSFLPRTDCEEAARAFASLGIALRAGLHCAPLAHESAATLDTGTLRLSFGHDASSGQTHSFLRAAEKMRRQGLI